MLWKYPGECNAPAPSRPRTHKPSKRMFQFWSDQFDHDAQDAPQKVVSPPASKKAKRAAKTEPVARALSTGEGNGVPELTAVQPSEVATKLRAEEISKTFSAVAGKWLPPNGAEAATTLAHAMAVLEQRPKSHLSSMIKASAIRKVALKLGGIKHANELFEQLAEVMRSPGNANLRSPGWTKGLLSTMGLPRPDSPEKKLALEQSMKALESKLLQIKRKARRPLFHPPSPMPSHTHPATVAGAKPAPGHGQDPVPWPAPPPTSLSPASAPVKPEPSDALGQHAWAYPPPSVHHAAAAGVKPEQRYEHGRSLWPNHHAYPWPPAPTQWRYAPPQRPYGPVPTAAALGFASANPYLKDHPPRLC